MRSDVFLVSIAVELAAHSVVRIDGPHGSKSSLLFGPQAIRVAADRRPHCEQRNDLQHMVLHHIADHTHLFVETSPALYAQSFGHCNLYALDVVAVPYRLQKRVRKAEVEQILDRFFAEVMIDPENRGFGEGFAERSVEFLRGRKVAAKWLFNDYPCSLVTARLGKSCRDGRKRAWRDSQVINRSRCLAERFSRIAKGLTKEHKRIRFELHFQQPLLVPISGHLFQVSAESPLIVQNLPQRMSKRGQK